MLINLFVFLLLICLLSQRSQLRTLPQNGINSMYSQIWQSPNNTTIKVAVSLSNKHISLINWTFPASTLSFLGSYLVEINKSSILLKSFPFGYNSLCNRKSKKSSVLANKKRKSLKLLSEPVCLPYSCHWWHSQCGPPAEKLLTQIWKDKRPTICSPRVLIEFLINVIF